MDDHALVTRISVKNSENRTHVRHRLLRPLQQITEERRDMKELKPDTIVSSRIAMRPRSDALGRYQGSKRDRVELRLSNLIGCSNGILAGLMPLSCCLLR
jgi:hypothetical protein